MNRAGERAQYVETEAQAEYKNIANWPDIDKVNSRWGIGMMKVVVAGGSGFLGRHVIAELTARGHLVLLLSRGSREPAASDRVESIRCDVAAGNLPVEQMRGCDAIVNLIGIKRETGSQTFKRAHVDVSRNLIQTARDADIQRYVHISVVASRPDPRSAYHDTKWTAEELVRDSGLEFTILKPGVIYGRGDDMITHLVKMIRFVPVFPVVGKGDSILQPVNGLDVAKAVAAGLEREDSIGKTYDVVGPEPMALREVVRTVAEATSLKLWIVNTPIWFQRVAVRIMNALFRNPLSTPAQLQMLIDGLPGDPEPMIRELQVHPMSFSSDTVREYAGPIPPLFGFSLRLFSRGNARSP